MWDGRRSFALWCPKLVKPRVGGSSKWGRCVVGGKLVFECTICGKAFPSTSKVTTHMCTHSEDCPFACTTSGLAFAVHQPDETRAHPYGRPAVRSGLLKVQPSDDTHAYSYRDRPFGCSTCDQALPQSGSLGRRCKRCTLSMKRDWIDVPRCPYQGLHAGSGESLDPSIWGHVASVPRSEVPHSTNTSRL